jgi:uridine kinase
MKIEEHDKPKMGRVRMMCDNPIDNRLLDCKMTEVCFSRPHSTLLAGGQGSGKTSFIIKALRGFLKKTHHEIIVFIPEPSLHSINEEDNVFLKNVADENIFHEYTPDNLEIAYMKMKSNARDGLYTILIIDDFGDQLREKRQERILNKIIISQRHLRASIFILTQNYYQLAKKTRENMTNIINWNTSKSINEKLFREQFAVKKEQFDELMKLTPTIHDYLILNLRQKRIFLENGNEVIL